MSGRGSGLSGPVAFLALFGPACCCGLMAVKEDAWLVLVGSVLAVVVLIWLTGGFRRQR
jgi:hypothetical protein